jgi:hypothetical protein
MEDLFCMKFLIIFLLSFNIATANNAIDNSIRKSFLDSKDTLSTNYTTPSHQNKISELETTYPIIKATGNQIYCPHTSLPIVTDISITDPTKTVTDAIYIQISTGYNDSQDNLTLNGNHPNISSRWDTVTGLSLIHI